MFKWLVYGSMALMVLGVTMDVVKPKFNDRTVKQRLMLGLVPIAAGCCFIAAHALALPPNFRELPWLAYAFLMVLSFRNFTKYFRDVGPGRQEAWLAKKAERR